MNILIVDDDTDILNSLKEMLEPINYGIRTTSSPLAGLSLFSKNHFDVLITDIKMDELSGIDLIKKIRELDSKIKIIVVSAYYNQDLSHSLEDQDIFSYLEKPLNIKNLINILAELEKNNNAALNINENPIFKRQ